MSDVVTGNLNPTLPPEIIDGIIDLLLPCKQSVSSCSLVAHSWLPRSRQHLFSTITLRGVDKHFQAFLVFVAEAYKDPFLCPVKQLRLRGHELRLNRELITPHMLRCLFFHLPNLARLELLGIALASDCPGFCHTDDQKALSHPIHLDRLDLHGFLLASRSPLDLVSLLSAFSSVKLLRISGPLLSDIPTSPPAIAAHLSLYNDRNFPSQFQVSSVEFPDSAYSPFFLALISKTVSLNTIVAVNVACATPVAVDALASCLGAIGPNIRDITVNIIQLYRGFFDLTSEVLQQLRLSACTHLANLTLQISFLPNLSKSTRHAIMFMSAITLISFTSATLQTVTLDILLDGMCSDLPQFAELVRDGMETELKALESAIKMKGRSCKLRIRWSNLQRIEKFECKEVEELCCLVRAHLPELDTNRMLSFMTGNEEW